MAGDIGFNFDSQTFGVPGGSPINTAGAVGPAHIVEVTDNTFKVFDKLTGEELVSKPLVDFWTDPGAAGAEASVDLAGGAGVQHSETRVVFDSDERRWFITSISGTDYSSALGSQNAVLVGISRSSNPTEDWTSVGGMFDTDGDPATPREPLRGGFETAGTTPGSLRMAVDADNLYVTVDELNPFAPDASYIFNKFNDLVLPTPTASNITAVASPGSLQWGMDQIGDEVGTFGLEVPANGAVINLFEATNTDVPGGVVVGAPIALPVTNYDAPPVRIRQLFDSDLENTRGGQLLTHTVRQGDYLWAVHAINNDNSGLGLADTSAVRWYQINVVTGTVDQWGNIADETENYTYPTIAVTDSGQVAISYTLSGINDFPSLAMSLGYDNNGVLTFEDPLIVKEGENGYFDTRGNFWGEFQTSIIDANNPETVYVFGQWADSNNNGRTQVASVEMVGLSVFLEGDNTDNTFIVRRQAANPDNIEVEIDGVVDPSNVYQELNLYSIEIDGMGGDDTFIVDTVNGELDFGDRSRTNQGGVVFVGDGDDQVEMHAVETTTWEVGVNGNGIANVSTNIPGACSPEIDDEVTFELNFEAGSLWFDATPWDGFADFGEALRAEVTNFYNDVMAPLFTGEYTVTLDINDDETDSFATSAAQGWGYEDVDGTMLYVASPWSILTGNGDRNGAAADAIIAYNLGLDLFGGDRQALLDNIAGTTRFQTMNILGMVSNVENATLTTDGIGDIIDATVLDYGYRDSSNNRIVGNQDALTNQFEVLNYTTNPNWANDNSGIYFTGIDDADNPVQLPVNSNPQLINFDVLASALAGSSRLGPFDQVIEQDRAFLRGMGYSLNPLAFAPAKAGQLVSFSGVDLIQAGDGEDYFCIGSSNVDLEVRGGDSDDYFNMTALGIGAVDLYGETGDDTYEVAFSSAGAITINDGIGTEDDTLIGVGTPLDDNFIITNSFIDVNGGVFAQSGVENMSFDGREGNDTFDIRENVNAFYKSIVGGDGIDTFIVNDQGSLPNGNSLTVSVEDPEVEPVDRVVLDIGGHITDVYEADEIENLQVDGDFIIDGINGTPTVAGGLNLLGDGDDRLDIINSMVDANWAIDGDGSGNVVMDVEALTFVGLVMIDATNGINAFNITQTDTDLEIQTNDGADTFDINNAGDGIVTIRSGAEDDIFEINNSGANGVFLFGEVGDDTYNVNLTNPGGLITIRDSVGSEMDTLSALGTSGNDHFIFDGGIVTVGSVMIDHEGIENVNYDGGEGDDLFEFRSFDSSGDPIVISGGLGNDRFWVNDFGVGNNLNIIDVKTAAPATVPDQLQIDISSVIAGTVFADTIENLDVDGLYRLDDVNGTPSVVGGLNLMGDGDERLEIESMGGAAWEVTGDGTGTLNWGAIDPLTFNGVNEIEASHGIDTVNVINTNTNLLINTRESDDLINFNHVGTGIVTSRGGVGNDVMTVNNSGGGLELFGEDGDDSYIVELSNPGGTTQIRDSVGSEMDTLSVLGTAGVDHFFFDGGVVTVGTVVIDYEGIEQSAFDGKGGDDIFEVIAAGPGGSSLTGGADNDTFIVTEGGTNSTELNVSVANPALAPDQLQLDINALLTDSYLADGIENLSVDGTYIIDDVNGVPTTGGNLNLLGDGDESLIVKTDLDADWLIDGDGSGSVSINPTITFGGLKEILLQGSGVDTFDIVQTDTDLYVETQGGDDVINIDNAGTGVLTVLAGTGDDEFSVLNSGGGVFLEGESGDEKFTYNDTGLGAGSLIGGADNDTFNILNSGSSTLDVFGDAGTDTFNIDNPLGTASTHVFGGDDDDLFLVFDSGQGDLTLEGQDGDDTYRVFFVDPTIDFQILDSVGAESDSLFVLGTAGDDTFDINNDQAVFNGGSTWTIRGIENFDFDGLGGNDVFNVDLGDAWSGNLTIHGSAGDDSFNIINSGSGVVALFGDSGDDTYTVFILPNSNVTIDDSSGANDRFFGIGTTGDDVISHSIGTALLDGGMVVMTGIEAVEYDGLAGNDIFNVADTATRSTFRGNVGDDTFNVTKNSGVSQYFGDAGEDIFNVTESIGGADFFGGDDNDMFNIEIAVGTNNFFGENGEDVFDVRNHAPLGSAGLMLIDGGANRNQMNVTGYNSAANMVNVTSTRITGLSAVPIEYAASGTFTVANGVGGITFDGNDGLNDDFTVDSFLAKNSLHMNGLGGNDRFTVRMNALGGISADGQEGSDLYQYAIGSTNDRFLFATDTGMAGSDRMVAVLTDNPDTINLSGTSFRVDTDNVQFGNLESMVLNTKAGDDTINVNRIPIGFVRILSGAGDDLVNVNNFTETNSILMDLGDGNDQMNLVAGEASGAITVYGNAGDDTFVSSKAAYTNALFDGQEGSDTYDISILDRSQRFVVARDTGVVGNDELKIRGTLLNDSLIVRSGIVITPNQDIISNQNTESMTIMSEGSDDVISIYGVSSPETNVMTQTGDDLVFVNSTFGTAPVKTLNIDLGGGQDTAVLTGTQADTTTTVDGGVGDDNIMLGSSFSDNNGNLDTLYGAIGVIGGDGVDRIYLNDVGRLSSANYDLGATFLNNAGPSAFFAGVTFDGTMETLRLDSTPFRNHVNVTPSHDTKFSFYGDGGFNTISLLGDASDGRRFWGVDGGDGFWNFTDGTKDVFFSDFFIM